MKLAPVTVLTILSTLLLGFYAVAWLGPHPPIGADAISILVTAIGVAGLVLAVMTIRELRLQEKIAMELKSDSEGFV